MLQPACWISIWCKYCCSIDFTVISYEDSCVSWLPTAKLWLEWEEYEENSASVGSHISRPGQTNCKNEVEGGIYPPKPDTFVSAITKVSKANALLGLSCLFLESVYWAAIVLAIQTNGWYFISAPAPTFGCEAAINSPYTYHSSLVSSTSR